MPLNYTNRITFPNVANCFSKHDCQYVLCISWPRQILIFRCTVVHPLVLLSVTDHHARSVSRSSQKRVIGVLLGQDNGKTINVANSFGIPFEEDEKDSKTWFLDHNYIEGMYEMFKKVNGEPQPCCISVHMLTEIHIARERMIGWYHTGPKLRASDQEINDLFKRFIARPVMVIVDVRPQVVGMPTDAYFAVEEIKDVRGYLISRILELTSSRMEQKQGRRSCMFLPLLRLKRPKRLAWSIFCATSKTRRRRHLPRE